jgi:spore coat polysaccharide biosynthesis protein SpsF (cytidylyltransferase family)
LIERLKRAEQADLIVVTTSSHPDDEPLVEIARECGVETFRGSEEDKLDRYLQAARAFQVDLVVVVDGDDPFCDPGYIDRLIQEGRASDADYLTVEGLPVGITANAIRVSALERVCQIKIEKDTEVWGGYFTQTGLFEPRVIAADRAHRVPNLRLTLDYPEDYQLFCAIHDYLHCQGEVFSLDDIFSLISRRPEIGRINAAAVKRYQENLDRITKIGIKEAEL